MYRHTLAWQVTAFMGLQSLLYYAAVSWLPELFSDRGNNAAAAGTLLAVMGLGNLFTSLSTRCWRSASGPARAWSSRWSS